MCVDVFAIIHYRLEQKCGFQFQFQTWSRMNSTSSLLELSFILAAAGFIVCLVAIAKSFSCHQYTQIIFTSLTGNVVPCLDGEFVSTWAVTVILIVNYRGRKQKRGRGDKQIVCFTNMLQVTYKIWKQSACLIQDKVTVSINTQFTGS